jgi:hypothetical protein
LTSNGGQNHLAGRKQAARLFAAVLKLLEIAAGTNARRHTPRIINPAPFVTILCEIQ